MTGLLLATLLNLSPGIQLIDNVGARHVALSDVRFRPLLVSEEEAAPPPPTFDQMSSVQLRAELRRLDEVRPGLGGPIALLSVALALAIPGAGLTVGGLIALVASTRASAIVAFSAASGIVLGIGVVMVTVGIILAIVGGVTLGVRLKLRSQNGREAAEVRRRLELLDPGQTLPAPALPVAPPPQAHFAPPGELLTVLTF